MSATKPVPAAQYVRMSTERQQYSLENQSDAIRKYADLHGFEVAQTYSDGGKTGVILRNRPGLQQLLKDVVSGAAPYRAILVYDVSRWGRFQDTDEPAHYEFLCKSAGIPVHYCAETFANDGTLASLIMKALKRTMAGEYSRELGVKVLAGQKRLARLGFKQGGLAGYGLQRVLVSPERKPKQILKIGERKSIATDRVVLAPGSAFEVECVRTIFQMLVSEGRSITDIVRELNRRGIKNLTGSEWKYQCVSRILTHPKYSGCGVYNQTTQRLYSPRIETPRDEWILAPGAFESIVEPATFEKAQRILSSRTANKSNEQILSELKDYLALKGKLSAPLIKQSESLPSPSTIQGRFGSLRRAYSLVGYGAGEQLRNIAPRERTHLLRTDLLTRIAGTASSGIVIIQPNLKWRTKLRLPNKQIASVLVARAEQVSKGTTRWIVDPNLSERNLPTLLARLNSENTAFMDFYVFPRIERRTRFRLSMNDPWLKCGQRLEDLSGLCDAVSLVGRCVRKTTLKKYG
jgi:DNA invertase Pin-like site-specific DNA recombinase